jgi:hypothetical protein
MNGGQLEKELLKTCSSQIRENKSARMFFFLKGLEIEGHTLFTVAAHSLPPRSKGLPNGSIY